MNLSAEQVEIIATKTAEAVKAKADSRKSIFGDGKEKSPSAVFAEIRNMVVPQEVREMAKVTNNFEMTRKWLNAVRLARTDMRPLAEIQSEIRAMSEGTAADGGYLVPEEFSTLIIQKKTAIAKMRRFATVIPMSTDKLHVPMDLVNASVGWEAENHETAASNPTFTEVVLTPFKLKALSVASMELLRDANVQVINYLADQFARKLAEAEDKAYWVGGGTTEPTGLRSLSVTSVTQASTALAYSDLLNLFMALPEQYRGTAAFVTGPKGVQLLMGLVDDNHRPIFMPSYEAGKPATLFGRPLIEVADWPTNLTVGSVTNTTDIFFVDLATSYIIGDRQGIEMAISTERWFEYDQVGMKAILRADGRPALADSARKLISVK